MFLWDSEQNIYDVCPLACCFLYVPVVFDYRRHLNGQRTVSSIVYTQAIGKHYLTVTAELSYLRSPIVVLDALSYLNTLQGFFLRRHPSRHRWDLGPVLPYPSLPSACYYRDRWGGRTDSLSFQ
jgi:hypothetical protein